MAGGGPTATIAARASWLGLSVGVMAVFLVLHGSATVLGSLRGEAGMAVAGLTVLACMVAQRCLRRQAIPAAWRSLGLGRPTFRSLVVALGICLLLLLTLPAYVVVTGSTATLHPGWLLLLPGLFAQAGIAEEVLFRGYLFGNLRERHAFWRAAILSAGPFVLAHLLLFATMDWHVALAATLLSLVTSFPLAQLFELGTRSIWAPALVHFTIQGAVKIVEVPGSPGSYQLTWLAACAVVPWLAFAFRREGKSARAQLG